MLYFSAINNARLCLSFVKSVSEKIFLFTALKYRINNNLLLCSYTMRLFPLTEKKSIDFVLKARFHYERRKDYFLFVLLIFLLCLALASILSAERSMKETKNALFHARSGNGPSQMSRVKKCFFNQQCHNCGMP